jgi:hypothetical protein
MVQRFDWRAHVARNTPGPGSPLQQQRQQVLIGMLPKLKSWFDRFGLLESFGERLKPGAYYGSVAMLDEPGALLLAEYSGWLFALDACTDEAASQQELETRTRRILDRIRGGASAPSTGQDSSSLEARLADSWADIRDRLLELRKSSLDEELLRFSLNTFAQETAAVVEVMAWERSQSLLYTASDSRAAPFTIEQYLEKALYSICVRAAGSLALIFEQNPREAWARWLQAMNAGARVLRLVNDQANIDKEFAEGKLNAVSLSLLELGWDGRTIPPANDPARLKAVHQVRERLAKELDRFSEESGKLPPDGPLATNVYASVAFTIAMYQHGDYQIPREHGAV